MTELLMTVGDMSLIAALTALVVIALRWVLVKLKAPAFVRLLLWAVVLFRMVCPVSFTSPWSAAALVEEVLPPTAQVQETREPVQQPGTVGVPAISPDEPLPEDAVVEITTLEPMEVPEPRLSPVLPLALLWLAGVVLLWGWWLYTHLKLKKRMETAVRAAPGVFESDQPGPPFVLGFFPPKIYLPRGLEEPHRSYVLAHERLHLRRGDFLWKSLFFLAAAVHWFNPVLWLAWRLFCRDLEASCDEGVLWKLPEQERTGYARALLALAAPETSRLSAAFGEHDVSRRVKGALAYRKPAVIAAAVLAVVAVGVGLWLAADSTGGAGLPQSPPAITLSLDQSEGELFASAWNEEPENPVRLLDSAPAFVDDHLWHHSVSLNFPAGAPLPDEGSYTDYLLVDGVWTAGETYNLSFSLNLEPRADSGPVGTLEERGVVLTYTWRDGFARSSATYVFRLLAPAGGTAETLEAPLAVSGGIFLPAYSAEEGLPADLSGVPALPMEAMVTVNDPRPFRDSQVFLLLLDGAGQVLDRQFVIGSSGEEIDERVKIFSSCGFDLNLADKGWVETEPLLLCAEMTYTWFDGSTSVYYAPFRAVAAGP